MQSLHKWNGSIFHTAWKSPFDAKLRDLDLQKQEGKKQI